MFDELLIKFSDVVVVCVKQLIEEEENLDLKLCVYVIGGGCFGFQYGFIFDEKVNFGDLEIEKNGVILVVDLMSI